MLYPFMTLADETEIVHSESMPKDGKECVKVCIEKPIDGGFKSATCWLPDYRWENVSGYTPDEVDKLQNLIQSHAATICVRARSPRHS